MKNNIPTIGTVTYLHQPDLLNLVDDFESWLASDGLTAGSIRNFVAQYREFAHFCNDQGVTIKTLNIEVARSYMVWLTTRPNQHTGKPLSSATRIKHYYTLRRTGFFLFEKGFIDDKDLVSVIRKPRKKQAVIQSFTAEQLHAIINATRNLRSAPRYKDRTSLLLYLLVSTGMRIGEALSLKLCDIDHDRRSMLVLGKGNKEREVPFSSKLSSLILEYASLYKIEREEYLFASRYGKPLASSSIRDILRKAKKSLGTYHGIDQMRVSPHTFRHTFARMWVVKGGNTIALSRILGHTSTSMTDKYVRLWGIDLNRAYDLCDPCESLEAPKLLGGGEIEVKQVVQRVGLKMPR